MMKVFSERIPRNLQS